MNITATYDYTDENGELLFQVVRLEQEGEPKTFLQRRWPRPDDPAEKVKGPWVWSLNLYGPDGKPRGEVQRVLYRLPCIVAAIRRIEPIWIAEGEKDVHALETAGVTATCNPGGAGKWRPEYTAELIRLKNHLRPTGSLGLVVVVDKDRAGHLHAQEMLRSFGEQERGVLYVRTVEAAFGKDAHDHLIEHKRSIHDFRPVKVSAAPLTPDERGVLRSYGRRPLTAEAAFSAPQWSRRSHPVEEGWL